MKNLFHLLILFILIILLNGCWGNQQGDDVVPITSYYDPVIVTRTEFENSVQSLPPQNLVKSGKIYIKDQLMFINDVNKGFHVYNYSNPQNPIKIGFIKIPGATDLAMRNNIIYINQAVDLVTLTYNVNNNSIQITNRNKNIFPPKISPEGFTTDNNENEIIIDWIPSN